MEFENLIDVGETKTAEECGFAIWTGKEKHERFTDF